MQVIYQIISAYFEDDCADELTNEPVMTAILDKDALASQPTLSRFYNRMDEDKNQALYRATKFNQVDYAVEYGEFMYQASSWSHPRRVVFNNRKALWANDSSIYLYCHNDGNGTLPGASVLLRQRQDGKFHQRRQEW